jgi:hypothetical protein
VQQVQQVQQAQQVQRTINQSNKKKHLRVELFPNNGRIKQKQKRNKCVHRNVSQT